nr:heterokaryon incompatibility protein (TOL) [Colletotrichum truncatum]KAF6781420.1 heterokaryon incompatibility protein (TOL) [Colletotrichum truncatum]
MIAFCCGVVFFDKTLYDSPSNHHDQAQCATFHSTPAKIYTPCMKRWNEQAYFIFILFPEELRISTDRHWRQLLQEAEITVKAAMSSLEKFWERFIYTHTSCKLTEQFYKDDDMWDIGRLMRDILGKANFDFEKSYLGRLRTEDFSGGKKQLETVAKKSSNAKENCGNGQMGNGWKLDEPSKLNSEKFAIQ